MAVPGPSALEVSPVLASIRTEEARKSPAEKLAKVVSHVSDLYGLGEQPPRELAELVACSRGAGLGKAVALCLFTSFDGASCVVRLCWRTIQKRTYILHCRDFQSNTRGFYTKREW